MNIPCPPSWGTDWLHIWLFQHQSFFCKPECNSFQADLRLFVTWWKWIHHRITAYCTSAKLQNEIMPGQVWWDNIGVVPGDVIVAKIVGDDHQDVWSRCGSDVQECGEIEDRGKAWNHIKISPVPSQINWIPIGYALSRSLLKVLDLHFNKHSCEKHWCVYFSCIDTLLKQVLWAEAQIKCQRVLAFAQK